MSEEKIGDEWQTPPEVFLPLHREFGFTLDVCANAENAKLPAFITPEQDGLATRWVRSLAKGEVCFLNPPYSNPRPWVEKAIAETNRPDTRITVVALLPNDTSISWFQDLVWRTADEVRFVRRRVRFLMPGGKPGTSPRAGNVIAVWYPHPDMRHSMPPRAASWDWGHR